MGPAIAIYYIAMGVSTAVGSVYQFTIPGTVYFPSVMSVAGSVYRLAYIPIHCRR